MQELISVVTVVPRLEQQLIGALETPGPNGENVLPEGVVRPRRKVSFYDAISGDDGE